MSRVLIILLLVTVGISPATAAQPPSLQGVYGDIQFAFGGVRHSDVEFNPGFASVSVGAWLWEGIGLEVYLDQGLNKGSDGDFDLEITDANGIAARFQGRADEGLFAYVVLGIVATRLEQAEGGDSAPRTVVQNYRGGRISIGFGSELSFFNGARLLAEYRNYFVDEDLHMDALTVGLQVSFQ
ncbi:MAG: hypothetical protein KTR33_07865 [Gammaproteobacteria bacterium]|nr:hypothetical protein [Gammaproteobacteria bacterium]